MAKKKKAAANPARGYLTTSIARKPKEDESLSTKEEANLPKNADKEVVDTAPKEPTAGKPVRNQVEQTPEELEAQLEHDELQLLVEKHATKVRRESHRHFVKFQTDRRVLRSQSENMTVHDWISNEVMDSIILLAQAEWKDSNRRQGQQPLLKILPEEDAIAKLWTLDLTLRDLGFSSAHTEPVLRWLCANAASVDNSATVWGLAEALEWLALDNCEGYSLSYGEPRTQRPETESPNVSRPGTPLPNALAAESVNAKGVDIGTSRTPTSKLTAPPNPTPADSDQSGMTVSDLDSDLEPDQLVPTYLKIKGKLFEIDPAAVDAKPTKQLKGAKGRSAKPSVTVQSPPVRKLLSQLQKIESDTLFDQQEADAHWPMRRNQIAQNKAAQRREDSSTLSTLKHEPEPPISAPRPVPSNSPDNQTEAADILFGEDDSGLLGDMFSAVPEDTVSSSVISEPATENVALRDFGKQSGLSPRKLLEEAVRSRDQGARLIYKIISPTTYRCRHSLNILWSKPTDLDCDSEIAGISITVSVSQVKFDVSTIATVSVEQSENFVSTVALFSLCVSSSKEEKIFLRLPPNWRDLYRGFLDDRKLRIDSADRDTIRHLRSIIQDQVENEESDGIVLTSRFKMRNQVAAGSSTASSGQNTPQSLDSLKEAWNFKSSTSPFQRMLSSRAMLPVFAYRDLILSTIDKHQVTIICGETGCGKSTQIPSFLLEHELSQGKPCKIFCTEPRRISAISLAQRVSEELGEGPKDLGTFRSLIGYAIRLESKTSAQTRLVYATVGVVLRMLESSRGLEEVTHLIIDEVHERSIDTDFLLIILRTLMVTRPALKVILMSATVDAQRFSDYLDNAPVLNIPGRTFPVQTMYLEDAIEMTQYTVSSGDKMNDSDASGNDEDDPKEVSGIPNKLTGYSSITRDVLSDYDEYAIDYELIVRLMEVVALDPQLSQFSSAILCFLPGIAEIRQLNDMLLAHPTFDKGWLLYPLHSTISSEEQQAAFLLPPPGMRKIVLATNIAETGVTIPDITCVIDTGKHKEMRFDERRQLSRLTQSFISRANAKQRRGRAGRVQEGLCFHLFTKYRHDNLMTDQQTPEMLRLSLQDLVMRTKICKLGDIEKTLSEALDPPSSRNIRRAIDALIEVDALTSAEELTPLGHQIAKLPLDAHLGKLVLLASMFGCVDVAITIAAILTSKSPFITPFGAKQRAEAARFAFKKGDSDLLTTYNAYKSWKAVCTTPGRSEAQFCHKNFLSSQNLGYIEDLKVQFLSSLVEAGFVQMTPDERRVLNRYRNNFRHRTFIPVPAQYDQSTDNDILVNSVIATAFYPKILIKEGKGWRNISNNQTVSLAPTSVNKVTPINPATAKYLSYYHIMQSSNKYYNAHSTSIVHPLPMVLMVGAEMDFKLHAGVISLPGNVLRFAVREWRAAVALKVLRRRIKEILAGCWKNPGKQLSGREKEWLGFFSRIFGEKWEKEERLRERSGAKAK